MGGDDVGDRMTRAWASGREDLPREEGKGGRQMHIELFNVQTTSQNLGSRLCSFAVPRCEGRRTCLGA